MFVSNRPSLRIAIWNYLHENKLVTLRGLILFNILLNRVAWENRLVQTFPRWSRGYIHKTLRQMEKEKIVLTRKETETGRLCYEINPKHLALLQGFSRFLVKH